MAIAYYAIEQAIAAQILADTDVSAITNKVVIEEAIMAWPDYMVHVSLKKRVEPAEQQMICAGKRKRVLCHFSIWCFAYALVLPTAITMRDNLLSVVEKSIIKERNTPFGRTDIESFWIAGGEFESAQQQSGFVSGGEIELVVKLIGVGT